VDLVYEGLTSTSSAARTICF